MAEPVSSSTGSASTGTGTGTGITSGGSPDANPLSREELITALQADRQWLLRQIDTGRWSEWRLDLAALERELGQLLDQVEQGSPSP